MATASTTRRPATLADLIRRLGDIPLERIRTQPPPGTATEADLIRFNDRKQGICELVDGVLVEKPVGRPESILAMLLVVDLGVYLREHPLGFIVGPDGPTRFAPGLVREPDVAVVLWERTPNHRVSDEAVGSEIPDLAVEILSPSNTKKEMDRKVREYFAAGVRLVWLVDPRKRTARVYTSPRKSVLHGEGDTLDGGDVLPGFTLSMREWFARLG